MSQVPSTLFKMFSLNSTQLKWSRKNSLFAHRKKRHHEDSPKSEAALIKTSQSYKYKHKLKYKAYQKPKPLKVQWDELKKEFSPEDKIELDDIFEKLTPFGLEESGEKLFLKISQSSRLKVVDTLKFFFEAPITEETADDLDELDNLDDLDDHDDHESDGRLSIRMNLNLFFSLSHRITSTIGEDALGQFARLTDEVNLRYRYDFNLKISRVGSYLEDSEKALDIDSAAFNRFMDALDGVIGLSSDNSKLDTFLAAADDFFDTLQETLPEAEAALEMAKEQIIDQVTSYFDTVQEALTAPTLAMQSPVPLYLV